MPQRNKTFAIYILDRSIIYCSTSKLRALLSHSTYLCIQNTMILQYAKSSSGVSLFCIIAVQICLWFVLRRLREDEVIRTNFFYRFYSNYDQHATDEVECIFLFKRGLLHESAYCQRYDPFILSTLNTITYAQPAVKNIVVDILLPSITAWILVHPYCSIDIGNEKGSFVQSMKSIITMNVHGLTYLFLPINWLLTDSSKIKHFCIALLTNEYTLTNRMLFLGILPVVYMLLVCINPEYLLFLPAISIVLSAPNFGRIDKHPYHLLVGIIACFVSIFLSVLLIGPSAFNIFHHIIGRFSIGGNGFSPSFGIGWYLNALALPGYEEYFTWMLLMQPVLCMIVVLLILFRTDCSPSVCALVLKLVLLIICFFLVQPTLSDMCLLLISLQQHQDIISNMRYLSYVQLGIAFPLVISFMMAYLWVEIGTGNANFSFFQNICFVVFFGLFAMEMTNTLVRRSDGKES